MPDRKRTSGGRFDPHEPPIYFQAGAHFAYEHRTAGTSLDWTLIAVNDLMDNDKLVEKMEQLVAEDEGRKLFLDSGIFNLTNRHMRAHGITMNEALALAPDDIDGFGALWDAYIRIAKKLEPVVWGIVELDQGGLLNKRITRARIEAEGIIPIPVYHPLNDGWDYFDELCEQYDRICFGNVVQADVRTRKHLLAMLWERKRRYPDVWVHILGLTPYEVLNAYPTNSCDSSSWTGPVRYGAEGAGSKAMLDVFGRFTHRFTYVAGTGEKEEAAAQRDAPDGYRKAVALFSQECQFLQMTWRNQIEDMRLTFDLPGGYPGVFPTYDKRENALRRDTP